MDKVKRRRAVVVGINLLIAAAHVFHPGVIVSGHARSFYFSYFSDVTLPFAFYFLFVQVDEQVPILRRWQGKCAVGFLLPAVCETLQHFGIWALGSTFDPWDYAAYALGVLAAALVDGQVLSRVFQFWRADSKPRAVNGPAS